MTRRVDRAECIGIAGRSCGARTVASVRARLLCFEELVCCKTMIELKNHLRTKLSLVSFWGVVDMKEFHICCSGTKEGAKTLHLYLAPIARQKCLQKHTSKCFPDGSLTLRRILYRPSLDPHGNYSPDLNAVLLRVEDKYTSVTERATVSSHHKHTDPPPFPMSYMYKEICVTTIQHTPFLLFRP
jgi:hypothetical protein